MQSRRPELEKAAFERERELEQEEKIKEQMRYADNTKYLHDEIKSLKVILAALIISKHKGQVKIERRALDNLRNEDCRLSYCEDKANRCMIISAERA